MLNPILAFFALGGGELLVVMLALILLFGAKDAPRILRSIQEALNKLQRMSADFRYKLMYEDLHRDLAETTKDDDIKPAEGDSSTEDDKDIQLEHMPADKSKP